MTEHLGEERDFVASTVDLTEGAAPESAEVKSDAWPEPGDKKEVNGVLCEWRPMRGGDSVRDYFVRTEDNLGAPGHDMRQLLVDREYAASMNLEPVDRLVVFDKARLSEALPDHPAGKWVPVRT